MTAGRTALATLRGVGVAALDRRAGTSSEARDSTGVVANGRPPSSSATHRTAAFAARLGHGR
ncbi:MAG: hypothetical protein ACRCZD_20120, partial [Phycicoccus sp.]